MYPTSPLPMPPLASPGLGHGNMTSPPKPASAVAAAFAELTQSFMAAASPQAAQPLSGAKRDRGAEGNARQQERSVRAKVNGIATGLGCPSSCYDRFANSSLGTGQPDGFSGLCSHILESEQRMFTSMPQHIVSVVST